MTECAVNPSVALVEQEIADRKNYQELPLNYGFPPKQLYNIYISHVDFYNSYRVESFSFLQSSLLCIIIILHCLNLFEQYIPCPVGVQTWHEKAREAD